MCAKAPTPPTPQAPPAPTPVRSTKIDATQERQTASRRAATSGYQATMLTGSGGVQGAAPTASPTLGG